MNVHLRALGCRLNEAELQTWATDFRRAGHSIREHPSDADVIVVNSCAVTAEAARKSRQTLRRYHRANPNAKLVVTGCYATLEPDEAAATLGVDLAIGNRDKDRLVELTATALDLPSMPAMAREPAESSLFARGRERAFVKVQDGCRYRCTYCIVTVARGEERSRTAADIIAEINTLQGQGVMEIVLAGVHLGGYGSDRGTSLHRLVEALLGDTDVPRLRLSSLEPWDLSEDFFDLFANPRLMPHLHLPLQSGSDGVLRRMARRCKTQQFAELVAKARARIPDFNVTTDVIVGFPGETDDEWRESTGFIGSVGFGHIHAFPFSPREGTKAARLPDPVPGDVKKKRCRELHTLASEMKRRTFDAFVGREMPVLWEGASQPLDAGGTRFSGYTPNYLKVRADVGAGTSLANTIRTGRLRRMDGSGEHLVTEVEP